MSGHDLGARIFLDGITKFQENRLLDMCTIKYAVNVRNGGWNSAPDGWSTQEWHQSATGDTNTSHTLPGRLYIVQCEWCPAAFAAHTKAEAMQMFRSHESEMLAHA